METCHPDAKNVQLILTNCLITFLSTASYLFFLRCAAHDRVAAALQAMGPDLLLPLTTTSAQGPKKSQRKRTAQRPQLRPPYQAQLAAAHAPPPGGSGPDGAQLESRQRAAGPLAGFKGGGPSGAGLEGGGPSRRLPGPGRPPRDREQADTPGPGASSRLGQLRPAPGDLKQANIRPGEKADDAQLSSRRIWEAGSWALARPASHAGVDKAGSWASQPPARKQPGAARPSSRGPGNAGGGAGRLGSRLSSAGAQGPGASGAGMDPSTPGGPALGSRQRAAIGMPQTGPTQRLAIGPAGCGESGCPAQRAAGLGHAPSRKQAWGPRPGAQPSGAGLGGATAQLRSPRTAPRPGSPSRRRERRSAGPRTPGIAQQAATPGDREQAPGPSHAPASYAREQAAAQVGGSLAGRAGGPGSQAGSAQRRPRSPG